MSSSSKHRTVALPLARPRGRLAQEYLSLGGRYLQMCPCSAFPNSAEALSSESEMGAAVNRM